jgi:hypothetical protein
MTTEEQTDHGQEIATINARGWMSQIGAMIDRLEHCTDCTPRDYSDPCTTTDEEITAALELVGPVTPEDRQTYHDEDDATDRIQESPLEVSVRSGWHSPGSSPEPDEYQILLTTGGPAARITGNLDNFGQPCSARLERQDWGTPWVTHQSHYSSPALLTYAEQFHFGG